MLPKNLQSGLVMQTIIATLSAVFLQLLHMVDLKLHLLPVQVSATHLATMHWHSMWKIPVRHIIVEEEALLAKGYTLETDMQLVATIQAPCRANEYAMRLPEASFSSLFCMSTIYLATVHHMPGHCPPYTQPL